MVIFARRIQQLMVLSVNEYGRKAFIVSFQAFLLVLMLLFLGVVETPAKEKKGTICVLPFQVNAAKAFSHLREGLKRCFHFE